MILLVYAGADLRSYMAPIEPRNTYALGTPPIPSPGWRTMAIKGDGGEPDPLHIAKGFGSIQIVMRGAIRIEVTSGTLREWQGQPGDAFVFVDCEGDGHRATVGNVEPFQAINVRLSHEWDLLKNAFDGWPDDARPYPAGVTL
jgi:hypothetical protein